MELTNKEKELIELIRNFQRSRGRMTYEKQFRKEINVLLKELMRGEGGR